MIRPQRRLRSALHHFDAGDQEQARAVLEETIERLAPGDLRAEALSRLAVVRRCTETGSTKAPGCCSRRSVRVHADSPLRVQTLITLAYALLQANQRPSERDDGRPGRRLGEPLSQPTCWALALGMRVVILRFLSGKGFGGGRPASRRA